MWLHFIILINFLELIQAYIAINLLYIFQLILI